MPGDLGRAVSGGAGRRRSATGWWAGVSRSMAATFILLNDRLGPKFEHDIARAMRRRAPHAYPNPLMVKLAAPFSKVRSPTVPSTTQGNRK